MALEGELSLFRLPDILQVISLQRKTGILTVQGRNDILAVSFLDGGIVAADALNQSFDELLGSVLATRGLIEPQAFSRLLEEQRSSGARLVEFLVERRAVGRDQVLEALEALTYKLLLDVLRWREGQFKFYGGEEVAYEEGVRPLRVEDLLMRASRDLPPEEGRPAEHVHGYLAYVRLAEARPVQRIPPGFDDMTPLDPNVVWVTPDEEQILARLDGHSNADSIAKMSGLGESRTYFALSRLLGAGLIRPLADDERAPGEAGAPAAVASSRPAAAPAPEALHIERSIVSAADEHHVAGPLGRELSWVIRLVPAAVALFAIGVTILSPGAAMFSGPGQGEARDAFERQRRIVRYAVIDRAAKTYHLLEGRYPAALDELVERGLLAARSVEDVSGSDFDYRPRGEEYELVPRSVDDASASVREGVFGDFLLDRSMLADAQTGGGVPLVLVD